MTVSSHMNGNKIYYYNGRWEYEDGTPADNEIKKCPKCGKLPTKEGYDACLGYLPGVKNACCGHGVEDGYMSYEDGSRKTLHQLK